MKKGLLIKADGVCEVFNYENLKSLQNAVGGYIEAISCDNLSFFLNEEGKLNNLPMNPLATLLVKHRIGQYDYIAGDVVVLGDVDEDGETLGLSFEEISNLLLKINSFKLAI